MSHFKILLILRPEEWQSGRMRRSWKPLFARADRGFESLFLRTDQKSSFAQQTGFLFGVVSSQTCLSEKKSQIKTIANEVSNGFFWSVQGPPVKGTRVASRRVIPLPPHQFQNPDTQVSGFFIYDKRTKLVCVRIGVNENTIWKKWILVLRINARPPSREHEEYTTSNPLWTEFVAWWDLT